MSGSSSASSVYMCYGSVRGEAEVPGKVKKSPASGGWMKLTGCSFSASANYGQRFAMQVEGGGEVTPVQVTKMTDASSTGLFRESLLGSFDKNAVVVFLRTGPDGPQEFMRIELEGCGIVDFAIDSVGEERASETFSIRYGRMSVISWGYDARGQAAGQALAMIENVA
ncbi:MAG TPA: type VI secretion system tube protein Hcp [Roseomonas sp.]|nr:type VI secretion system tube protein Hcp [Roseomonas sp.]